MASEVYSNPTTPLGSAAAATAVTTAERVNEMASTCLTLSADNNNYIKNNNYSSGSNDIRDDDHNKKCRSPCDRSSLSTTEEYISGCDGKKTSKELSNSTVTYSSSAYQRRTKRAKLTLDKLNEDDSHTATLPSKASKSNATPSAAATTTPKKTQRRKQKQQVAIKPLVAESPPARRRRKYFEFMRGVTIDLNDLEGNGENLIKLKEDLCRTLVMIDEAVSPDDPLAQRLAKLHSDDEGDEKINSRVDYLRKRIFSRQVPVRNMVFRSKYGFYRKQMQKLDAELRLEQERTKQLEAQRSEMSKQRCLEQTTSGSTGATTTTSRSGDPATVSTTGIKTEKVKNPINRNNNVPATKKVGEKTTTTPATASKVGDKQQKSVAVRNETISNKSVTKMKNNNNILCNSHQTTTIQSQPLATSMSSIQKQQQQQLSQSQLDRDAEMKRMKDRLAERFFKNCDNATSVIAGTGGSSSTSTSSASSINGSSTTNYTSGSNSNSASASNQSTTAIQATG